MKDVYVVLAYKWGCIDNHSYIVGVFSDKEVALKAARVEEDWRAGKYECEVSEVPLLEEWVQDRLFKIVKKVEGYPMSFNNRKNANIA